MAEPIPGQITGACQHVRPATPTDAVAGVQPWIVAAPSSTQEASALLRAAAALDLAVVPRGTGSRMHWGYPPERCDLIVEMTRMNAIIEHAAGDLVATVQAGVSLGSLAQVLGAAGQRLALDPPGSQLPPAPAPQDRAGGTVGGVLATGAAGPLRLRYGTGRDLLIGITVVRADGTIAKSGGKVVKNVAGYDLGKLFAGSRGTLGLITQATFRLHPVPVATACVVAELPSPEGAELMLMSALESTIAPVAAELRWPSADAPIELAVAVEGDADGVIERAGLLSKLMTGNSLRQQVASQVAGQAPDGDHGSTGLPPVPPWWDAGPLAQSDGTVIQVACWPGDLARMLNGLRATAEQAGLDPVVGGSAGAGVLHAGLPAECDPQAVAAFVTGLRAAIAKRRLATGEGPPDRASVAVLHAPPAVGALVDLFGPVPALSVMRAVKQQFDPGRLMSPGRFAGRI